MKRPALTLFELLIALCVILLLIGFFGHYMNRVIRVAREEALRNELVSLRMAIEHFRIVNGKAPQELTDLANKILTSPKIDSNISPITYFKDFRRDSEGFLLDPFNSRYGYDRGKGIVYSETEGCRKW